jgi:hypothetical protein
VGSSSPPPHGRQVVSRRRRSWWDQITPTGLIVTATAALAALALSGVTALLYLKGELAAAKDCGITAAAAITRLIGMAARTRPDTAATVAQPISHEPDTPHARPAE